MSSATQIVEDIVKVVQMIPLPQILEEIVEVVKLVLQERAAATDC